VGVGKRRVAALEEQLGALTDQLRLEKLRAEDLARQVEAWCRQATEDGQRAEKLQQLVWQLQARARTESDRLKSQLSQAQAEAHEAVSPGAALLAALAAAGLGAAIAGSNSGRRRG
jgi:hypothetical protein